jgi:CRP-like cAMP-binding protein
MKPSLPENSPFRPVIDKLTKHTLLDGDDEAALLALPHQIAVRRAGAILVREGDRLTHCCVLVDGFAFRSKVTADGSRQILSFHMPGDMMDLQHLLLERADHSIVTLTDATVALVPLAVLRDIRSSHPNIADGMWRDTLIDAAIFREWVLNVGQRDARTRIAHMLCEFAVRRQAAGLGGPEQFTLPMSQEQIADATGLTSIHVNRMLAILDEQGVFARDRRHLEISDWDGLQSLAGFDPACLHGIDAPRAPH